MAPEKDLLDELSNITVISHSSFVSRLLKVYLDYMQTVHVTELVLVCGLVKAFSLCSTVGYIVLTLPCTYVYA